MRAAKTSKKPQPAPARRTSRGLKALSTSLPRVAVEALGRRGFADGALVSDWSKIVGHDLARASEPLRLSFADRRERRDGTLLLRVDPAFALILQHLQTQLLERVNGFFGYRAVAQLRILQGPVRGADEETDLVEAKPLDPNIQAAIEARLTEIEDEAFRAALLRLAQSFHGRSEG
jgi:hypothetical protein